MKTVAQLLKHDFKSKGSPILYDSNGNLIYYEDSSGFGVNVNLIPMVITVSIMRFKW
jgi:hypothetical protein